MNKIVQITLVLMVLMAASSNIGLADSKPIAAYEYCRLHIGTTYIKNTDGKSFTVNHDLQLIGGDNIERVSSNQTGVIRTIDESDPILQKAIQGFYKSYTGKQHSKGSLIDMHILNLLGADGWEIIKIQDIDTDSNEEYMTGWTYTFKRKLK